MASILLTGPSGFVGSHILPGLLDAGHRVRGLVRDEDAAATMRPKRTRAVVAPDEASVAVV